MRKALATKETVEQAVGALQAEGLDPTVERVRSKVGGGSFSTISRLLNDVLAYRAVSSTPTSEIPAAILDIGQRSVAAIYAAVNKASTTRIDLIETEARKQVEHANQSRAEATLEIERLEQAAEEHAESMALLQQQAKETQRRAALAEDRVQSYEATTRDLRLELQTMQKQAVQAETAASNAQQELKIARAELAEARIAERQARDEAAELRGQIKAKH